MLILTVDNAENVFYVDMSEVIHSKDLILKRPLPTMLSNMKSNEINVAELQKSVESIRIPRPSMSFKEFSGKIKMKNNPKTKEITLENFLIGGSKIIECK